MSQGISINNYWFENRFHNEDYIIKALENEYGFLSEYMMIKGKEEIFL